MRILLIFLLSLTLLFTGCGGGSSDTSSAKSTQFLSVPFAPAADDVPIGIEKIVTITFSADIDRTTVDDSSAYIMDANKNHIPAELRVTDDRISIIPTDYFLEDSRYTIVITTAVADVEGRTLEVSFTFVFTTSTGPDMTPPSLVSYSPEEGTSVDKSSHVIMEFDELIVADEVGLFELLNSDTDLPVEGITIVSEHTIRFAPIGLLDYEGNYTATLLGTVEDIAGNEYNGTVRSWAFSVDPFTESTPPSLLSVTPPEGILADKSTTIIMEFDEAIVADLVDLVELNVTASGAIVLGSATVDGNILTFAPTADLTQGEDYTATLTGAVTDAFGNEYNGTMRSWDFSVTPAVDLIDPGLFALTPEAGASEDIVTEIIMAFDESIADNGVELQLKDSDTDTVLSGSSSVSGNAIHFIPDSNLTADGNYTVTLQGGVEDLATRGYTGQTSWDFSVNTVDVLSVHRDDYKKNGHENTITIEFSEDLDLSTVSEDDFEIKLLFFPLNDPTVWNYTESARSVSFVVYLEYPENSAYNITVSGDIKNLGGNSHNNGEEKTYWFGDENGETILDDNDQGENEQ